MKSRTLPLDVWKMRESRIYVCVCVGGGGERERERERERIAPKNCSECLKIICELKGLYIYI